MLKQGKVGVAFKMDEWKTAYEKILPRQSLGYNTLQNFIIV